MAYTDIDDPTAFFQTVTYTGNGATGRSITLPSDTDMQPDWVWLKSRGEAEHHQLTDSVRGVNKQLYSHLAYAQASETDRITAFNSDGFTIQDDIIVNKNTIEFVAWNWKAGTSFTNDASSTSVGDIDSAGSVNQDAGFSIISFTKTDGEVTVAHGLGAKPSLIIFKPLASANWIVTTTINNSMSNNYLLLHASDANQTDGAYANPTSSVFSISNNIAPNSAHIAYCFAPKQGYSKFGSYTGNGNVDGTFVYTGFKPAFVMVKITSEASNWDISTGVISANQINERLRANLSNAEESSGYIDFLSNGFKMRNTNTSQNKSGSTYIYMAFAENPFVTSSGVPATAR